MDPTWLGRLCVERGLIDEGQLAHCLEVQRTAPCWRRLGEVMLREGVITGVVLGNLLSIQASLRATGQAVRPRGTAGQAPAEAGPPPTELGWFLREARANGANGLVLGAGQPPAFRIAEDTHLLEGPPLREDQIDTLLSEALPQAMVEQLAARGSAEGTLQLDGEPPVRATLYRHAGGIAIALRVIAGGPVHLADLGLPPGVRELTRPPAGLVLITGPSGSGASLTLGALLGELAERTPCHIAILERVRELVIDPGQAWITRRCVGPDSPTFSAALRATCGADVDVVAVTELSYPDAIAAALDVATSGKLVLGVMHTPGVAATVQRVLDTFADARVPGVADALAGCLSGILSQRMLARADGTGHVIAAELMLATVEACNLIRENRVDEIPALLHSNGNVGMMSLEDSLARLCRRECIRADDALAAANDADALQRALASRRGPSTRVAH